jgi:methylated-DNA-[protein]-cysteine S-methyltransferase
VIDETTGVFFIARVGWLCARFSSQGLRQMTLPHPSEESAWLALGCDARGGTPVDDIHLARLNDELTRYFAGELLEFSVPLDVSGHTPFRRMVWAVDRQIPYGQTRTYGWIAAQIGRPFAGRAVGGALAANPIPIIIPCHRVVRHDGSLGGYTGGVQMKATLLALERGQRRLFW